jgi:hypothetical protein
MSTYNEQIQECIQLHRRVANLLDDSQELRKRLSQSEEAVRSYFLLACNAFQEIPSTFISVRHSRRSSWQKNQSLNAHQIVAPSYLRIMSLSLFIKPKSLVLYDEN